MAKKTIEMIVQKVLKWHKNEVAVLWLLIAIGAVLIITGAGVYFYISRLAIVEQTSLVSNKYFLIAQVKILNEEI